MKTVTLRGDIVLDNEVWKDGAVLIKGNRIVGVERDAPDAGEVHEYPDSLIAPGFVDLQVNGYSGIDIATEPERVRELSKRLAATGTTSYLPTVISSPETLYQRTLSALSSGAPPGGAEVLGIHLEGPFVSRERAGAHPRQHIAQPDLELLREFLRLGPIKMLTLAPELDGAMELVRWATRQGVFVSAGHSNITFDLACSAFREGVAGVTHLFNAMSPLHHREPGLPGAAITHPRVSCGIIVDGLHVHPTMVDLVFRLLGPDLLYLVTDAVAATGAKPGRYALATRQVKLEAGGIPTLEDGTLAGGALAMNEVLKNLLAFTGCTIPEAVRMASVTPARLIGEGGRKGRLCSGYDADIVVLRHDFSVRAVYKRGESL